MPSSVFIVEQLDVARPEQGDSREWLLAVSTKLVEKAEHYRNHPTGYDEQILSAAADYKFVADEIERLRRSSANAGRTRGEVFGQLQPIREDARCLAESTDNLVKSIDLVLEGSAP